LVSAGGSSGGAAVALALRLADHLKSQPELMAASTLARARAPVGVHSPSL
jgi:hypothetical protein